VGNGRPLHNAHLSGGSAARCLYRRCIKGNQRVADRPLRLPLAGIGQMLKQEGLTWAREAGSRFELGLEATLQEQGGSASGSAGSALPFFLSNTSERSEFSREDGIDLFDLLGICPVLTVENLTHTSRFADGQTLKTWPQIYVQGGVHCADSASSGICNRVLLCVNANARFVTAACIPSNDAPWTACTPAINVACRDSVVADRDYFPISNDQSTDCTTDTI
jgi:hypothetical protein